MRRIGVWMVGAVVLAGLGAATAALVIVPPTPAEDFKRAYIDSGSDFVRAIVRDERVTDQEFSESYSRYRDCDAALGIPWLHTVDDRETFDACQADPLGLLQ